MEGEKYFIFQIQRIQVPYVLWIFEKKMKKGKKVSKIVLISNAHCEKLLLPSTYNEEFLMENEWKDEK